VAAYEILLLNTAIPQIQAAQAGDTYVVPRDIAFSAALTLSAGTANGVPYLNGSKVLTTGSALTFDGTTLTSRVSANAALQLAFSATNATNADFNVRIANSLTDLQVSSATPLSFTLGATEQMRLTSTGLGIGTSSPTQPLSIAKGAGSAAYIDVAGGGRTLGSTSFTFGQASDGVVAFFQRENAAMYWATNSTERMRLDSSGNLGLGVTPSAWGSGYKAWQVGYAALSNPSATYDALSLTANLFYDGTNWKFIETQQANRFSTIDGIWTWEYATGNAGATAALSTQMTLDASGRLGIGTTSPVTTGGSLFEISNSANCLATITCTNDTTSLLDFRTNSVDRLQIQSSSNWGAYFLVRSNQDMKFGTNNTERARITSGGYFKASDDGTYNSSTGAYHELKNTSNNDAVIVQATNASYTSAALSIYVSRNTTNGTFNAIQYYNIGGGASRFFVADSGNVTNTNGSYGTISDQKMKTDIVDAGSQWSDIKALRFRKFKMKDDPSGLVQLGVVAQEVEQTSPGLVDEHTDRDAEGNDLGSTTKSVKTSVLLMKAAVALQEAMARIETLEAKIAALEQGA